MKMLERARELMTPEPEGNIVRLSERIGPHNILYVSPIDYSDISTTIRNAVKENTAMTETTKTLVEQFRDGTNVQIETLTQARKTIEQEKETANAEHTAQIKRLEDEFKSRTDANADANADFDKRILDASDTIFAMEAALSALPGAKDAGPIVTTEKPDK